MANDITREGLAEALLSRTPPIVLEALPRKYFDAGHIPTARALPLDELEKIVRRSLQTRTARSSSTARARPARIRMRPRSGWPTSATTTSRSIRAASRTGRRRGCG
jgi:hypothetical protein